MDQKIIVLIVVAVLAVIGVFVLIISPREPAIAPETQLEAPAGESVPAVPARVVTVTGTEFAFEPSEIKAVTGERLRIVFVNAGSVGHNFVISELDVGTPVIGPGEQSVIEFSLPAEPGSFTLGSVCTVPGHKERGMVGTLLVE